VLAEKDAVTGDMHNTLKKVIQSHPPGKPYTPTVLVAASQFCKLVDKQRLPAEFEEVIGPLVSREGVSQMEIREELETFYIWFRKGLANARIQQGRLNEAQDVLQETYDTVRSSHGKDGLGQWHAAYLLMRFLEPGAEAEKYRQEGETLLKLLYGSKEKLAEGMNMGIILLEQGALEEAEHVFASLYELSTAILGKGHEMTGRASKLKQRARSELEIERKHTEEGNFAFEFGSLRFPRKIEMF
jgi:hypothetical protein